MSELKREIHTPLLKMKSLVKCEFFLRHHLSMCLAAQNNHLTGTVLLSANNIHDGS